jgi:hypothetical protein
MTLKEFKKAISELDEKYDDKAFHICMSGYSIPIKVIGGHLGKKKVVLYIEADDPCCEYTIDAIIQEDIPVEFEETLNKRMDDILA